MLFLRGSDMGLGLAHTNAAWLLRKRPQGFRAFLPGARRPVVPLARALLDPDSSDLDALLVELDRRASEQGASDAALRLAEAYRFGRGTAVDVTRAVLLYRSLGAARRDPLASHLAARFALASMYERGEGGVPLDWNLAKRMYEKALDRPRSPANIPVRMALLRMRWALTLGPRLLRLLYPGADGAALTAPGRIDELRRAFYHSPSGGEVPEKRLRAFPGFLSMQQLMKRHIFMATAVDALREVRLDREDVVLVVLSVVFMLVMFCLFLKRAAARMGLGFEIGGLGPDAAAGAGAGAGGNPHGDHAAGADQHQAAAQGERGEPPAGIID